MGNDPGSPEGTAWRLTYYPRAVLGAIALAFVFVVLSGSGSSTASGRVGGDYPAFYTAGTLVAEHRIDDLYDAAAQAELQDELLGGDDGYLAFAYAPHVAAAYAPLAMLPYRLSYVVHTSVMFGALIAALHLLRPLVGVVDRWFSLVLVATVTSYPMFMALGGGQNTAVTFLLLVAVWRALHDGNEPLAGLAAGLLLFRPQYAVPLIGLLLVARHRRAVLVAAGTAAALYAGSAALLGWNWVETWLEEVGPFLETDAEVNAANSISTVGFLQAVLGVDSPVAVLLGGAATAAVACLLAVVWWRGRLDLGARMALTATGIVLLSPHAMFYDAGLVVMTVLVLVDRGHLDGRAAAALWGITLLHTTKGVFDATPVALVVLALLGFAVARLEPAPARALAAPDLARVS